MRFFEETRALAVRPAGSNWRIETDRGTFEATKIINCGGAWAHELAAGLGEPVPLEPIAPMMIITSRLPPFCTGVVGAT